MLCISPVDKIVETVYNGVNKPGLSTAETVLKVVDKGKPACYDMLTIVRKEEVNMLKNGWNVYGRRLAPEGTVR